MKACTCRALCYDAQRRWRPATFAAQLTGKLDYIKDLWRHAPSGYAIPYPSPQKDDGYETIADYCDVHPDVRHARRFQSFPERSTSTRSRWSSPNSCFNHTSDQHPWFQRRSRSAPFNPAAAGAMFYRLWSDDLQKYQGRPHHLSASDVEISNWTLDPHYKAYYWHRFFSHQPDLNFDNPEVQENLLKIVDFWLDLGVDSLRTDAVPYALRTRWHHL